MMANAAPALVFWTNPIGREGVRHACVRHPSASRVDFQSLNWSMRIASSRTLPVPFALKFNAVVKEADNAEPLAEIVTGLGAD